MQRVFSPLIDAFGYSESSQQNVIQKLKQSIKRNEKLHYKKITKGNIMKGKITKGKAYKK